MKAKILIMVLLVMAGAFAYSINASNLPTTVYAGRDTGFYVKVMNDTANESVAGIDV